LPNPCKHRSATKIRMNAHVVIIPQKLPGSLKIAAGRPLCRDRNSETANKNDKVRFFFPTRTSSHSLSVARMFFPGDIFGVMGQGISIIGRVQLHGNVQLLLKSFADLTSTLSTSKENFLLNKTLTGSNLIHFPHSADDVTVAMMIPPVSPCVFWHRPSIAPNVSTCVEKSSLVPGLSLA